MTLIAGRPTSSWVFWNCVIPDLKLISPAEDAEFVTDLRGNVKVPDFMLSDDDQVHAAFTEAAVLCWFQGLGMSRTVAGGMLGEGRRRQGFLVHVAGGMKADREIQERVVGLAEDTFRVFDKNPARDQPGGTLSNTWGGNTTLEEDYLFHWEYLLQGIGTFTCTWRVDLSQ